MNNGWTGKPLEPGQQVIALKFCPDCKGRGWFLINPFRTGGSNGAGDLANMTQCQTCLDAHEHFKTHGKLPDELAKLMEVAS